MGYFIGFMLWLNNNLNIFRDAVDTLGIRRGTNGQRLNIYNTYTDDSNNEHLSLAWSTNIMFISTRKLGSGIARALEIGTEGNASFTVRTNATERWTYDTSGGLIPVTDNVSAVGDGSHRIKEFFSALDSIVTSQFDKTASAVLANVPGLSLNLVAAGIYEFEADLFTASNVASGIQCAIAGTATATAIRYEGVSMDGAALKTQTRVTALAGAVCAVTAVTAALVRIKGYIQVNAGGTLTVQFAQNVSGGVASSVLIGSTFKARRIS